ncbi:MAG TPA: nuclear transport factor 2 family protein, partial [Pseudonocardia sp.]|nr:nuclear transport factor 2 family protein [Pseudonocardia sp.]
MDIKNPRDVADTYFRAWKERDFTSLREILADDVSFQGPLATLDNADDCVKGLEGMAQILDEIVVQHVFVDGPDVLTWFDLHTTV